MSIPTPKFKIGDTAYFVQTTQIRARHDCPDCLGTRKWPVSHPVTAVIMEMDCPRCTRMHYNDPTMNLDYTKHIPAVQKLTIATVRIDTGDQSRPITYMCRETSSNQSGSVYDENQLHADKDAADAEALVQTQLRQSESDAQPHAIEAVKAASLGYFDALRTALKDDVRRDALAELRNEFGLDDAATPDANEHTPGVWHVSGGGFDDSGIYRFSIEAEQLDDGRRYLTVCNGYGGLCDGWATKEQGPANAALMAAAPRLLKAVKAVLDAEENGDARLDDATLSLVTKAFNATVLK